MNEQKDILAIAEPPEAQALPLVNRQERLAAWLQFPRRVVLLLIAYGLVLASIAAIRAPISAAVAPSQKVSSDWSMSWRTHKPVADMINDYLPNTLLLLGTALLLAFLLALIAILIAALVHKLEEWAGPLGSILKGLGRLWIFGQATTPVAVLAMFLVIVFVAQLRLVSIETILRPGSGLADRLSHLSLPTLALALLPALLTAQAVAREVTLPRKQGGWRLVMAGLLKTLGMLFSQVGALLSGLLIVESMFAWPGVGRLLVTALSGRDYPVLFGILAAFAGLVLIGRLLSEFFRWLERLMLLASPPIQLEPRPWRRAARIIWIVLALLLLLAPLAYAVAGVATDPSLALRINDGQSYKPPSPEHPWGTDTIGRDVQARVLRGALGTLEITALIAVIVLLPSLLGGALTGFLASRRTLLTESLADLLLLPADVLLFVPLVVGAITIRMVMLLSGKVSWVMVALTIAIVLLPRMTRVYQTLWMAAPERRKWLVRGIAGVSALFAAIMFAGYGALIMLGYLGFDVPPAVAPSDPVALGSMLLEAQTALRVRPEMVTVSGVAIWVAAFAFYTAADALVGFFNSKEALVRLNE